MQFVDYYKTLEIQRDASADEISRAYKKMARKYHPDLNREPGAEDQFKQVNEAHEVLKDPQSRQRYDTLGANWKHGSNFTPPPGWGDGIQVEFDGGPGAGGFSSFFESIFGDGRGPGRNGHHARAPGGAGHAAGPGGIHIEDLLGGINGMDGLFGGNGPGAVPNRPARGRDMETTLTLKLEDVYHADKIKVRLDGPDGPKSYDVRIPAGVRQGERIRLTGQGGTGAGGEAGDLYLRIAFATHPRFTVEHQHLVVKVPVSAWDAALGGRIPVPTMDGEVQMTLPPGLSSGQRLRLKGKGLPLRDGGRGDLRAELEITVPRELTSEQRRLFSRLRDQSDVTVET